jgi:hypothetical protein
MVRRHRRAHGAARGIAIMTSIVKPASYSRHTYVIEKLKMQAYDIDVHM